MSEIFNIYCDESCHLESKIITQDNRFMVLGGISCSVAKKDEVFSRIKSIKKDGGMTNLSEMKWTKVANGKLDIYKDLINYFFDCSDLSFRAVVIGKEQLNHNGFNQSHDDFYYKMYWQMLEWFVEPKNKYNIYLDLKDTRGSAKIQRLRGVLCNSHHDFDRKIIERIQEVRSHEIAILQLTDLIIGAISYVNRYPKGGESHAKNEIVKLIQDRSKLSLRLSTSLGAKKFNMFCWEGQK
jgi:hypothetical protein